MSEHKQREKSASLIRLIEASEQERVAMHLIFANLTRAKGVEQSRQRRCRENFKLNEAAEAMADAEAAAEAAAEEKARKLPVTAVVEPKPVRISQFSPVLVEYETTADVIEYFSKLCETTDIPGGWLMYSGNVLERMEDKSYKAPSVRATEEREKAAAEARPVEDRLL